MVGTNQFDILTALQRAPIPNKQTATNRPSSQPNTEEIRKARCFPYTARVFY